MDGFASFEYISVSTINDGHGGGVGDAGEDDDVDGDDDEGQEAGRKERAIQEQDKPLWEGISS